ncbi:MAG: tetratricopeptide repeat protein [Cyclobacteriaceae bacterium]
MRYFFSPLFSLILCAQIVAQTSGIETIDSLFSQAQRISPEHPDSAYNLSEEIRILSRESNYDWGLIQSKLIKASILFNKNQLDSASRSLLELTSQIEAIKDKSMEEGIAKFTHGKIYFRLGSLEKSLSSFTKAQSIFRSLGDNNYLCMSTSSIGTVYGRQGDYPRALEYFLEALKIAEDGNLSGLRFAEVSNNIALVYGRMGLNDEALDFAKKAMQYDLESGSQLSICKSYNAIAGIYYLGDKYDSALYYYNLSIKSAEDDPQFISVVQRALSNISNIYTAQGKQREAINLLESVHPRNESQSATIANMIAANHLGLGEYKQAIEYARKALLPATSNNIRIAIRNSYEYLQKSYWNLQVFDSAYHYLSKYNSYQDSIYNESNDRKFGNLRIELETLEKQKEIEILQKQSEIDEANRALYITVIVAITILSLGITIFLIYRNRNKRLSLQSEIEKGQAALQQQTLHMMNLNNSIQEIETGLKSLKKKEMVLGKDVQSLLNNIFVNRSFEREWEQLETHFSKIHPNFNIQVLKRHDNLTQKERRLLALIKLDLNTREISNIFSIEQRSVVMSRYRLKQKLGLAEKEDLAAYVQTF